ncbi:MAG TPA: ABC transporter ATP-binding protein [Thermoanaerobaculia bacterium]|nr:ABC transporter ATP-binding protein [Thermoanaerobaculia bacterium]
MDITLNGIRKRFSKEKEAIAGVDLRFPSGKVTAIVGPSGSGKSTLLNLIAGLLRPDAGTIFFDERDVTMVPPERRDIGFVFQSYALFPHLSVEENITFALHDRPVSKGAKAKSVSAMLKVFEITHLAKRRPRELSGGERQRVALARALAREPQILLLDEPLSALDAQLREHLRRELGTFLHSLDRTSVYVTHDRDEAMLLGDELVVMRDGSVVQSGTPAHVYRHPVDSFVANFFGDANLVRCDLDESKQRIVSPFGTFSVAQPLLLQPGQVACMLLRPEMFVPAGADGVIRLTVRSANFLGSKWRVEGRDATGVPLVVDLPSDMAVAEGEIVNVRIPRSSIHVLAVEAGRVSGDAARDESEHNLTGHFHHGKS